MRHGKDEWKRFNEMGSEPPQQIALAARLSHEAELPLLEVAETTMYELRGLTGGARREVVALDQAHGGAAAGCVECDPGPRDPAADHKDVERIRHGRREPLERRVSGAEPQRPRAHVI